MKCHRCKDKSFVFCKGKNCKGCCDKQEADSDNNNIKMEEDILYKDIVSLKMEDGEVYTSTDDEIKALKAIITTLKIQGIILKNIIGISVHKRTRFNQINIVFEKEEKMQERNYRITHSQDEIIPGRVAKRKSRKMQQKYPKDE